MDTVKPHLYRCDGLWYLRNSIFSLSNGYVSFRAACGMAAEDWAFEQRWKEWSDYQRRVPDEQVRRFWRGDGWREC